MIVTMTTAFRGIHFGISVLGVVVYCCLVVIVVDDDGSSGGGGRVWLRERGVVRAFGLVVCCACGVRA